MSIRNVDDFVNFSRNSFLDDFLVNFKVVVFEKKRETISIDIDDVVLKNVLLLQMTTR